jgi:biopolymer transport protein ExbD
MKRRRRQPVSGVEMPMGPMIDMVFLLLVFFMVTARPLKPEADIAIGLPGAAEQDEPLELPDEQKIIIQAGGAILLNELPLAEAQDRVLENLFRALSRLHEAARSARSELLVTLAPDDAARHQRIVDVLNACARAGIRGVTFDNPGGEEAGP